MTWRAGFAVFLLLFASAFDGVDAASANNVDQGLAADTVGDYARALTRYRKLAAQGDAWGQNNLGHMYENGRGVPRDYAEAVKWYRKSAAQGNAWGQANLGYMYENGRGVSQDHAEAAKWYRRSAEQGFSSRQFDHRRRDGNGADNIAREQEVASEWRCAAVTHGASEHIHWCARMEDHGGPAKPQGKLAGSFLGGFGLQKASSKASFKTWGAPKSKRDEAMWKCRQMAMTGVADAQYHLGGLLSTDRGKARDPDEAHMWLTLAAANGHACAANQKDILGEKLSSVQIKKARARAARCLQSNYKDCDAETKLWWQKVVDW